MLVRNIFRVSIAVFSFSALFSCSERKEEHPFKGHWTAYVSNADDDGGNKCFVRLDFYDNTVCADGFENVAGVLSIAEDRAIYKPITADVIKRAEVVGENEARIEYVQQSSGQLWSATLTYDPESRSISFANGKMLSSGHDKNAAPAKMPYSFDPSSITFEHVSDKPNFKQIPGYNRVLELPDRVYYRSIIADETIAPPFGEVQLRCYYPETDRDINITNELGESPLSSKFMANIIDCWPLPGEPGLMLILWTSTERYQEYTLYRIGERNVFRDIDYVTGRRPSRYVMDEKVDSMEISSIIRNGKRVRVYDPASREVRVYDLAGHLIERKSRN